MNFVNTIDTNLKYLQMKKKCRKGVFYVKSCYIRGKNIKANVGPTYRCKTY